MLTSGLYYGIFFTVSLLNVVCALCSDQIPCPCGNTRRTFYYTHCLNDTQSEEDFCVRFANCETCRANVTRCVTCPTGRSGPTCDEVIKKLETCIDPGTPDGAIRESHDGTDESSSRVFLEGESLYFFCDEDYTLEGSYVLNCTSTGNWSDILPRCQRGKTCPDPGMLKGGSRENAEGFPETMERIFIEGEKLIFNCDEESSNLTGENIIECTSFGNWTDSLPKCQRAEVIMETENCTDPGTPAGASRESHDGNDEASTRDFQAGESLYFFCDEDYTLAGSYVINCTSTGNWSDTLPSCQKDERVMTTCPDPGIPEGGNRKKSDGTDDAAERVFQEGESVYFSCNEELALEGFRVINCTSYGTWSHARPTCEEGKARVTCPDPGVPDGLSIQILEETADTEKGIFTENVSVHYYCNDIDYDLKGESIITCTSFGNWSNVLPSCEKGTVTCPDPGVVEGGRREIADGADDASERTFLEGEFVRFECNDKDSVLEGDGTIYCTSIGTWTGALPQCKKTGTVDVVEVKPETCPDPGIPEGGSRQNAAGKEEILERSFKEGESIYFYCKEKDSDLKGESHITCTSVGWSGLLPKCEKDLKVTTTTIGKPCEHPGIVENAIIENSEGGNSLEEKPHVFPAATRLKYRCKEGFKLEGQNALFCLCSGEWTSKPPRCLSESTVRGSSPSAHCKSRGSIPNGRVNEYREMDKQIASDEEYGPLYTVGTRLNYECNEGYTLKGEEIAVCKSSGLWSAREPKCIKDLSNEDDDEEQVRSTQGRRGSGKPNSLTFKFYFN